MPPIMPEADDRPGEEPFDRRFAGKAAPSLRVIVVDDNEDNAEILAEFLRQLGHFVRAAPDGSTAIQLLSEVEAPDAMFLDLTLPDMSGLEVAVAARAKHGDKLRIIAITGHSGSEHRKQAERAGCDSFLVKPFTLTQIEQALPQRQSNTQVL